MVNSEAGDSWDLLRINFENLAKFLEMNESASSSVKWGTDVIFMRLLERLNTMPMKII